MTKRKKQAPLFKVQVEMNVASIEKKMQLINGNKLKAKLNRIAIEGA